MHPFSFLGYNARKFEINLETQPFHRFRWRLQQAFANDAVETLKESPLSTIPRRKFIQLSAAAAAGCLVQAGRQAHAEDMPNLSEDDDLAKSLKYVHNSTVPEQNCANCMFIQGEDGAEWRPCSVVPGKLVNANGWCSVWQKKP